MARYIIANRLAGRTSVHERVGVRASMDSIAKTLPKFSNVFQDHQHDSPGGRRLMGIECDPSELESKKQEWGEDIIVEAEVLRYPAVISQTRWAASNAIAPMQASGVGTGAQFEAVVRGNTSPIANASVNLTFKPANATQNVTQLPSVPTTTDAQGKISVAYDASQWTPIELLIIPKNSFWSSVNYFPKTGQVFDLQPLPKAGPLGWWHQALGVTEYTESRGKNIRIGMADTGVGPHPYLAQVNNIGSFIGGKYDPSPKSGLDVLDHGTHVCGILGARPTPGSGDYGGIASGADIYCARVFSPATSGVTPSTNADLANAIDSLALQHQVDLLNLSLGGEAASMIEQDAIWAAMEAGTLTIAAAGNYAKQPVLFPAGYNGVVAVTAIGVPNDAPDGTLDAGCKPDPKTSPDKYSGQVYLASFSNFGTKVICTGPGVGIVSTVPSGKNDRFYAAMSGTSLSSPAVCAALASLLSEDAIYTSTPRGPARSYRAYQVLTQTLRPLLGLAPTYVGGGLATAWH